MNNVNNNKIDNRVIEYQTNKLQELISELHHCCKDRLHHEASTFNIPPAELRCLMLFDGHKYLTGQEIASQLEVAKSRATVILEGLEKKGFIQRITDPKDARSKLVSLTPAGLKKVQGVEEFVFDLHHKLLDQIDPSQRNNVIASLEILRSSMVSMKAQFQSD